MIKITTPTKNVNKDTIEISITHILSMYPLSLTLSTLLPFIQTSQVTVIKKLIDWFLYKHKNIESPSHVMLKY